MCLMLARDESSTPRIATRNITVYKELNALRPARAGNALVYYSPYYCMRYRPGKTYSVPAKSFRVRDALEVHSGFHAFTEIRSRLDFRYSGVDWADIPDNVQQCVVIVPMTVPRGARYFIGEFSEIVSDRIYTRNMAELCVARRRHK